MYMMISYSYFAYKLSSEDWQALSEDVATSSSWALLNVTDDLHNLSNSHSWSSGRDLNSQRSGGRGD